MPKIRSVLIIVENLPVPFDRRVWMEATTLRKNGYRVSVISPTGKGYEAEYEVIDGIHVYRHPLPPEHSSAMGYLREYACALYHEWRLARKVKRERGFQVLHACNPPDLIFLVAAWFKLFGRVAFLFDHHDLNPELFESKFNRRGFFHWALKICERLTFFTADTVISTNTSYRDIAIERGNKAPSRVHVVRSGPDLSRFKERPLEPELRCGKRHMVGYLGVMGEFDGVDHLVRAAHHLITELGRTDSHFVFIGDGPCREQLIALAQELGIADYCTFTGRVSDEDLLRYLSACTLCVDCDPLNPLNDKSTMNKILEYMALGKPIVQYDLTEGRRSAGAASDYATPNDHADLAVRISGLLDDQERRHVMGKIGKLRMSRLLEWRFQAPRLLRAYEQTFSRLPGISACQL